MKKSYYAIIPANVRYDKDLTDGAKLLYGEITALCNEKGFCWAGDSYFVDLYGVSRSTIQRWFKQLEEKSYIQRRIIYENGTRKIKHRYTYLWDNPIPKNETTPIPKNETDNNTVINNTSNSSSSSAHEFYENNFGMINPFIYENINHWINDLSNDLVIEAMKIALKAGKQFNYAEGILRSWLKNNVRSINDVRAIDAEYQKRKESKNNDGESNNDEHEYDYGF